MFRIVIHLNNDNILIIYLYVSFFFFFCTCISIQPLDSRLLKWQVGPKSLAYIVKGCFCNGNNYIWCLFICNILMYFSLLSFLWLWQSGRLKKSPPTKPRKAKAREQGDFPPSPPQQECGRPRERTLPPCPVRRAVLRGDIVVPTAQGPCKSI